MKSSGLYYQLRLLVALSLFVSVANHAVVADAQGEFDTDSFGYLPLSEDSMSDLVEPIAFYPDSLLRAILAASTFPDQIVDAALLIKTKEDAAKIKDQSWDSSVKLVSTYPGVLGMMFEEIEWTTGLGQAYLNQHKDLLAAIQRQRLSAQKNGKLKSNDQQKVTATTVEGNTTVIQIEPTNPEVVYVPTTTVVESGSSYYNSSSALVPLATFGVGLALGAALNDDDNHYYYGGGPGYWYRDDYYNNWQDNRRAAWEDYNDRAWDRQDHRQDMSKNRQEFRQDMYEQGKYPTAEQREQRKQQFNQKYPDASQKAAQRQQARQSGDRSARAEQYRSGSAYTRSTSSQRQSGSSSANRGWSSSSSARSSGKESGFSSYGSRGSASSYSSRGASSRGYASMGGGGMKAGGAYRSGGGRAGGGGRRR